MESLDADEARRLVMESGTLLCMDVPVGLEVGIDMRTFTTGPQFRGIKMIPRGFHLIYYNQSGAKVAFFLHYKENEVVVKQWDKSMEDFSDEVSGDSDRLRDAVHRMEFDRFLGPYPLNEQKLWEQLTNYVSENTFSRANIPVGTKIVPGDVEVEEGDSKITPYFANIARTPHFSDLSLQKSRLKMLKPEQVTSYCMDPSQRIEELIESQYGGNIHELFGEFQLSFVLFLFVGVLSGLEFWKTMTHLVCTCDSELTSRPELMIAFAKMLENQLGLADRDLFRDILLHDNFMRKSFNTLFLNFSELKDQTAAEKLKPALDIFRNFLKKRFSFDPSEGIENGLSNGFSGLNIDEDGPVVVSGPEEEGAVESVAIPEQAVESVQHTTNKEALQLALDDIPLFVYKK